MKTETTWSNKTEKKRKEKKKKKVKGKSQKEKNWNNTSLWVSWWNNAIFKREGLAIMYEKLREMPNRVPSRISIIIEPLTLV